MTTLSSDCSRVRYTPQARSTDPTFRSLDAKSIATDHHGTAVYTSPNMSFIPEPHNGEEEVRARADGRFGTADCFQWPQIYCEQYCYAVCVRRKEHYLAPDPLSWAWYRPQHEDFEPLPHAAFPIGKLTQSKAVGVASLYQIAFNRYNQWKDTRGDKQDIASRMVKSLGHDIMLLRNHPLTFRDIVVFVTQAQRYFLDILAFLDYVMYVQPRIAYPSGPPLTPRSHWMGCFTQDTKTCDDLFHAGVPVWLVRSSETINSETNIEKHVKFTFPEDIIRGMYSEGGKFARPFICLYRGPGGFQRHLYTRCPYTGSTDPISGVSNATTPQRPSKVGKAPTQAQSKKAGRKSCNRPQSGTNSKSRDKWVELRVPDMPLSFPVWENAMKRVDKDLSRVKSGLVDQGYRVPEPALLITPESPERRQLFMKNWLAIRPLWISRLDHDPPARFPSSQQWREILHGVPSREELETAVASYTVHDSAKGRKLAVLEIFGDVVAAMTGTDRCKTDQAQWREKSIPITSLVNPPPRLIKAILWEIFEIGWRYELCALDQILNPRLWAEHRTERLDFFYNLFPGSSGLVLWSEPLPSRPGDLGLTDSFFDNERVLRPFCLLLSTWPNAHPSFSYLDFSQGSRQAQAYDVMSRACHFYAQTFFDYFGRPPLLPHQFPWEYNEL